jgi:3-hydroxybutyryl-CoA dehydratase
MVEQETEYDLEGELEVGDTVEFEWVFREEDITTFSELVGDRNPLHTDEEFASESIFEQKVVHGVLALGVLSAALARLPGTIIYKSVSAEFEAPVHVGDTILATVKVVEELDDNTFRVDTTLSANGSTVVTGEASVLSN